MKWVCRRLTDYSDAEYDKAYSELSLSRKRRVDAKKMQTDRKRSLLAEIGLRELLAEEGIDRAVIENDINGRPYIKDSPLYISFAHSGDIAVAAISSEAIGIDVERVRKIDLRLVSRVCTEEEKAYMEQTSDKTETFFEIWTAKEAYFKKEGTGITNLKSVNILSLKREIYKLDGYIIQIVF